MVTPIPSINAPIEELLAWGSEQPWGRAMASCPQDPEWHAEGDVWTHTEMVCRALEQLPEWSAMTNSEDKAVLAWAALLHDVGKPARTVMEDGRWRSPGHARTGSRIARRILDDAGFGVALRERIVRLVACHMKPAHVIGKPDPEAEAVRLSWLCETELLYTLARADTIGRIAPRAEACLSDLDLWRSVAEDVGAFPAPYAFADDHARVLFFRGELPHYSAPSPWANHPPAGEVVMLSGLPGAGKDSWVRASGPRDWPVVSLDELRNTMGVDPSDNQGTVIQAARELARQHLRDGQSFVLNATNIVEQTRRQWIDLFLGYRFRVRIVYIDPGLEGALARNKGRTQPVPDGVIQKLFDKLDVPLPTEAHEVTYVL